MHRVVIVKPKRHRHRDQGDRDQGDAVRVGGFPAPLAAPGAGGGECVGL
jgi:hypothetical protein